MPYSATILISVFNGEETLDRCFESIRQQTFQDFRITCIDDASNDDSLSLLARWQSIFGERLLVLKNPSNIGLTRSLNIGLKTIDTPYTARLDADDWWLPQKLDCQITYLQKHPECGILGSAYVNHFLEKEKLVRMPLTDEEIREKMFQTNPFGHSTVIFQTGLVKEAGGYDESIRYGQDYELWLRLSEKTKLANLPHVLCHRNADSGISVEKQNAQMHQYVKTQLRYLKHLKRPFWEYGYIFIPLLTTLIPEKLRYYKRKYW